MNLLRTRFYQAGFPAINFMVINSMLASENTELLKNEAPSIPVYQELPGEPVKDILGAGNDHILVLDRYDARKTLSIHKVIIFKVY